MDNPDNPFNFLMVMVSVIIGFGVTEILAGSARLLRARSTSRPYWIHTLLIVGFFLAFLSLWWEAWGLRLVQDWSFPGLVFMLSGPVGLYLVASLIFPDAIEGCDFRVYYFENRTLIWGISAIVIVAATLFRPIVLGHPLLELDNLPSLLGFLMAIILAWSKRPTVHGILAPLSFLLVAADQLFFRYLISYV